MEPASLAIAVRSLATQLVEAINKLRALEYAFKDAPPNSRDFFVDLNSLFVILNQIQQEEVWHNLNPMTTQMLEVCRNQVEMCMDIVKYPSPGLESQSSRTPNRRSVKTLSQDDMIKMLHNLIQYLKRALSLVHENRNPYAIAAIQG